MNQAQWVCEINFLLSNTSMTEAAMWSMTTTKSPQSPVEAEQALLATLENTHYAVLTTRYSISLENKY